MLSRDRAEFFRLCEVELNKATELTGAFEKMDGPTKAAAQARLNQIALDMAECLPNRIPCSRVAEMFRVARTHYSRVPNLNDLHKAWDNHMRTQDAPVPTDAPRLAPPPMLSNNDGRLRKLAAVRTALAVGKDFRECDFEEWMREPLEKDPQEDEVRSAFAMCTPSSRAFYIRRPDITPNWGKWFVTFGLVREGDN